MIEFLQLLKSYWWLVLGAFGFIAWIINTLFMYLKYRQEGEEYIDKQQNRRAWWWVAVGFGVLALILLLHAPKELESAEKALPLDESDDAIEL